MASSSTALLIRLKPTSPWRIGPSSGDRDRVDRVYHSDSLYAALCSAMQQLGWLEEWLDATARAEHSAVAVSSCYPYLGDLLLVVPPKHVWPPPASSRVRWQGAKFVPLSVVDALIAGRPVKEEAWIVEPASECLLPSHVPAGTSVFRTAVRSAAAIDREGQSLAAHSTACIEFAPSAGFWFAAQFRDAESKAAWADRFTAALRLLCDTGFGGERTQGWGRADMPVITEGNLPQLLIRPGRLPQESERAYWMLSLYHPSESDPVDWKRGQYALTSRSGRVESSAGWGSRKRETRMVTEGSVVIAVNQNGSDRAPLGSCVDVAPEGFAHPVYRSGIALAIALPAPKKPLELKASEPKPAVEAVKLEPVKLEPVEPEPATQEPIAEEQVTQDSVNAAASEPLFDDDLPTLGFTHKQAQEDEA
jgi:CRISPR type III-A-associated RAMP protein Csm4